MKILQIMTELGCGGAEKIVLELSGRLLEAGHSVHLAVLKDLPAKNLLKNFEQLGMHPDILGINSPAAFLRIPLLRKVIRKTAPDIIHSHLMHPNLAARIANIGTRIPLVNTIHISERRPGQGLYFLADTVTSNLCSCYTAVSDASARFHEKAVHLVPGSIRTIRNGSDPRPSLSTEELTGIKAECGLSACTKILGSLGRFDWQKGFDRLLRVLPELQQYIPDDETWGVLIFGDGPERPALEKQVRDMALRKMIVRMPGFRPDAASAIELCNAFVMPSRYEGYGLAMAEAMNLGLPLVYAPVDSLPELARNYLAATPADFANPESDPETALILSRALNQERALPLHLCSTEKMAAEYLALYRELAGKEQQSV